MTWRGCLCPRSLLKGQDSVIGHNRQGSELAQFRLVLLLPLLVRVARLVKLLGQVSEDLVHFGVVHNLGREAGGGWLVLGSGSADTPIPSTPEQAGQVGPESLQAEPQLREGGWCPLLPTPTTLGS